VARCPIAPNRVPQITHHKKQPVTMAVNARRARPRNSAELSNKLTTVEVSGQDPQ